MQKIEALSKAHDRKSFDCGKPALNQYLQKSARQHATRNLSRTFVLLDDEQSHIIMGYFTMTLCEVHPEKLVDSRLTRYPHPIPAANLARLAVDKKYQGNGIGRLLIVEAMKRVLTIAEAAGLVGLFVDAKDSASAEYYEQLGFIPNPDYELVLFMPLATIKQALHQIYTVDHV